MNRIAHWWKMKTDEVYRYQWGTYQMMQRANESNKTPEGRAQVTVENHERWMSQRAFMSEEARKRQEAGDSE